MNIWDLGGHELYRTEWVTYMVDSDIIIFVVDSSDYKLIG
jgi:GTPase SAR1 family protein